MKAQNGNALFLILIAVALFAALSYAITQSGRGGGTISREQAAIAASQITQQGAAIQSAVQRMVISGISAPSICYDSNKSAGNFTCDAPAQYRVFDPDGGGVVWPCPTPEQIDEANSVRAVWNMKGMRKSDGGGVYVKDVGTNTDVSGREAIAHLWNVKLSVCQQINKGLGLDQTPADNSDYKGSQQPTYDLSSNVIYATPGQPFACVDNGNATTSNWVLGPNETYMYYHTLVEQ